MKGKFTLKSIKKLQTQANVETRICVVRVGKQKGREPQMTNEYIITPALL